MCPRPGGELGELHHRVVLLQLIEVARELLLRVVRVDLLVLAGELAGIAAPTGRGEDGGRIGIARPR